MTEVALSRLRDLFLAPTDRAPATQAAVRAVPSTLAVLASATDAPIAGTALGLAVAAALGSGCAVTCVWSGAAPTPPRAGLAVAGGRRLADRLSGRGLLAAARGRLVHVALPAPDVEARAAAERTIAAAGDLPVVLVVAGARPPALDPLLEAVDRIVIVPAPDALAGLEPLALDAAARLGRSTAVLRLPPSATTAGHRLLTSTGLILPPSLRAAATAALEGSHA
ncbi:MAG TPA: hypothetical protein VI318_04245 [Baekduia sp.]